MHNDLKNYKRDEKTGAILNNNMNAYNRFKAKEKAEQEKEERLEKLESKLDRIESLLQGLVENGNN